MDINSKAMIEMLEGIKLYVDKKINKAPFDKTEVGRIIKINDDGTYNVVIKTATYKEVKCIGNSCMLNQMVYVKIPKNNYSFLYIENI